MTFNNDVDMGSLFNQFYTLVTGKSSSGFTILEISYSIGIGLGVLIFFNHFGQLRLSDDPTPMQVQMRTYEDEVNQTLIEQAARAKIRKPDHKYDTIPYPYRSAVCRIKKSSLQISAKSFFI